MANRNPSYATSAIKKKPPSWAGCYSTVAQARGIRLEELPARSQPQSILMCDPWHFSVIDVKNAFMEGNVNRTSAIIAAQQWDALRHELEKLGHQFELIRSCQDREDMVFSANQVLLGEDTEKHKYVVLANMVHPSRQLEIPYFEKWFRIHGYRILQLQGIDKSHKPPYFEGQGDALWHHGVQLLWGGWGHRSEFVAFQELSGLLDVPILTLHLVHPRFYHLDTAFCPLNRNTVMYYPKAFDIHGNELIRHFFKDIIVVDDADAENFACNALPLGKDVLLQKGSNRVCAYLRQHGFNPIEVETSEFMKSGGSVSCLIKLIY
jgi:N-dimethylarginine dimethylaminohydrolase